jgi:hypothetical protein
MLRGETTYLFKKREELRCRFREQVHLKDLIDIDAEVYTLFKYLQSCWN